MSEQNEISFLFISETNCCISLIIDTFQDAFRLLRKKFAQQGEDGAKASKGHKGPKVPPKPHKDGDPKPTTSKGATGKEAKDKPKDKPKDTTVHKDQVNLKPTQPGKKVIHATEEKQPIRATPKTPTDRKSSLPEEKLQGSQLYISKFCTVLR